jgi:ubiquinone/menaquinone biosynthesis C-methylase UbiE
MSKTKYIPALRFKWLTPFYDFLISITMPEKKIKQALVEAANVSAKEKILDFGCGTGTLTIMIKEFQPEANVTGIDVDVKILNKAIEKTEQRGLDIFLIDYDGRHLPFQDRRFNKILSCLVFHHLDTNTKKIILAEIFRVVSNNGKLYIADFGRSKSWLQRTLFNIIRGLDGFKSTDANAKGLLPELISEAGFANVTINKSFKTMFGEVQIISAEKYNLINN